MLHRARSFARLAAAWRPAGSAALSVAAGTSSNVRVAAVLGAQWGDEGKGKLADLLAGQYDYVARFNGGANAGHTVVVGDKKYAFHLLPCGLVHPRTVNVIGNGCVVHAPSLLAELQALGGAVHWQGRLLLSDRAHLLFDFHKKVDGLLEERRRSGGKTIIGTTKQGIGPAYAAKASRSMAVRASALRRPLDEFRATVRAAAEAHMKLYDFEHDIDAELQKYEEIAEVVKPMLCDTTRELHNALAAGKRVLAEGANAAMLDLDFGTFPFVTSSSTTVGGVCTGLGLPPHVIDARIGVVKAYTTRVGGGPFPTELTDERGGGERPLNDPETDIGLHLQKVGGEIGVTTGRKRRCGWFDAAVVRYAHALNGFTSLNLTKLDVLDELETIKIGVNYVKSDGSALLPGEYPSTLEELASVKVEYVTVPGWRTSTRGITSFAALPPAAQDYIRELEKHTGVRIMWVGTGPRRTDMLTRRFTFAPEGAAHA